MQAQVPLKSGWYALLAPLALVSEMPPSGEALFEFLRQLGPTGQVQAAQSRGPLSADIHESQPSKADSRQYL